MERFKNILVVYDDAVGGDDALGSALTLTRGNEARLTLATVLRGRQLGKNARDETQKRLARLAASVAHDGGCDVDVRVLAGTPHFQIIRQVLAENHDLVVTSAAAGNASRQPALGTSARQLMLKCPCPVWVVKPRGATRNKRILAAVDPLAGGEDGEMNARILELATSIAKRDEAILHVFHAWEVDGNDHDTIRSEIKEPHREEIIERHRRGREAALRELLGRYTLSSVEHHLHLPRDRPAQAIIDHARDEKIDLIVMGTHGRTGIPRLIAGNTVEAVIGAVYCNLLTVKPAGFRTPIALSDHPLEEVGETLSFGKQLA